MYFTLNIIRLTKPKRIIWVRCAEHLWEITNAYKILVGKPEEKTPFGRIG
jgi:hypothetical protein